VTEQRGSHQPSVVRDLGRGLWGVVKWLLGNVALLAAVFVLMGVIAVVSGLVDRFNRWVTAHHIAPALLVVVTALLSVCFARAWDEAKAAERSREAPRESGPDRSS